MSKYLKEWIFVVVIMSLGMTAIAYSSWPTKKDKGTFGNVVISADGVIECGSYSIFKVGAKNEEYKYSNVYDVEVPVDINTNAYRQIFSGENIYTILELLKCFQKEHSNLEILNTRLMDITYVPNSSAVIYRLRLTCIEK